MKNIILLLWLVCSFSYGQNLENLKIQAKKIHNANYNMDFEPLADLTYPGIVEQLGGRTKFVAKLDNDYQNEEFRKRIQIENPAFQYSEIRKIDGKNYCVITYYNPIRYFIESKMDAVSGPKKAAELKQIEHAALTVYEPNRNTINVKRNSTLIAISDESTQNQWKFINMDDLAQREISGQLLNESIKKELGL